MLGMFKHARGIRPGTSVYYRNARDTIALTVQSLGHLASLQSVMKKRRAHSLQLFLQDTTSSMVRTLYETAPALFPMSRFVHVIDIPLAPDATSCELVTRVVYREINEILQDSLYRAGQTRRSISLNRIFDLLVANQIGRFLDNLDPTESSPPCTQTRSMLKWIRDDTAQGFRRGEYRVEGGTRASLEGVIEALHAARRNWPRHELHIEATGYGDSLEINHEKGGISLDLENAGYGDLAAVAGPAAIRYAGCRENAVNGDGPIPLGIWGSNGQVVGPRIWNNCELGAVRGFAVAAYLARALGVENVDYQYATGGISRGLRDDPKSRRVDLEITVLGGRLEESGSR